MKKPLIFSLLLSALTSATLAATPYQTVEEMVSAQPVIRVLLDEAPGFGNQSATVNLMNRLRAMHFEGSYELIYPDRDGGEIQKVVNLFNLPDKLPPVYSYEDKQHHKITFIAESAYIDKLIHHQVDPVALSVTGAHDMPFDEPCEENASCNPYSKNFAIYTNASVFVELQPWIAHPEIDSIILPGHAEAEAVKPPGKYLVYPVSGLDDAKRYLIEDPLGISLVKEKPALNTLIDSIESQRVNVMSVYGYTFQVEYNWDGGDGEATVLTFPQNILQVVTGVRYAQLHGSAELQKPVIIPVFYDYTREISELQTLLVQDNWGEYEGQGGVEMRAALRDLGLTKPNTLLFASLSDADASQKIQSLQAGQVLLLSMGPLPKLVFDGIYSHTASNMLPAFREGEGSLSMLIMKGKPHFRCEDTVYDNGDGERSKWEPGMSLISDEAFKARFMQFYKKEGFCSPRIWKKMPRIYETIGQFIIESANPASAFSQYFVALHQDALKPENDRINRALEEALKTFH